MNYNEIVSVSKLPGLYQIHKQRADGLIIKSLIDEKIVFAASRAHSFTPLENITVYTQSEPIELFQILLRIKEFKTKNEIPSSKASNEELKAFFAKIVPDYDTEKVYISDIQKIIKWYNLLEDKDVIKPIETQKEAKGKSKKEEAVEEVVTETAVADEKPKTKKKTAKKTEK